MAGAAGMGPDGAGGGAVGGAAGTSGGVGVGGSEGAPTPGQVACDTETCSMGGFPGDVCCLATMGVFPTTCAPSFPGCITGGVALSCDDATDCAPGQICCFSAGSITELGGSRCESGCGPRTVQLCRTNSECPTTECREAAMLPGYAACF